FGQGVAKDERQARQKFLEAYALGDFDAATRLGDCALNGWGVEKNEQEALQYYQEASEANRPAATNALADLYELGHGVAQDDAKALELRRKAAEQNNSTAQKCLGDYYLSGLFGLPVDAKEAVGWYERSVAQNNVDAMLSLAPLLQFGVGGVQRNEVRASELTEKAARLTAQAQLEDGAASFNNDNTSDDAS
ncbi:MAG: sel1 repeat family protein, partial [Thermoguttaceae bacterium]|nr:sel1 repeat family protein [Thermoguttaceae bacterium]